MAQGDRRGKRAGGFARCVQIGAMVTGFGRTLAALVLALLAAGAARAECPPAPIAALSLPVSRAAVAAGLPLTVLAFGSSSTEGAGASDVAHTYPARLEARLLAALPAVPLRVLNRGRGGEDVAEMLARLDAAVLAEKPDLVIWQTGSNATLRGLDPEWFRASMAAGLARLPGIDVVLMDSQTAPRILAVPNHARFGEVLAELAVAHGASLFSRTAAMRAWEAGGVAPAALLVGDGLHHNDRGYDCVASALAEAIVAGLRPRAMVAAQGR
jgi:acyl-CoA thioesterase I